MFDTKVMVAPNSPSARANASTVPARTPGKASGSVTLTKFQNGLAPSGSATAVATSATRNDSATAVHSSGVKLSTGSPTHRSSPRRRGPSADVPRGKVQLDARLRGHERSMGHGH